MTDQTVESDPLEFTIEEDSPLVEAVRPYQLELASQKACLARFQPLMHEAKVIIHQAQKLNITGQSTELEKKLVRTTRLALRDVRCRVENERKTLKEDSLKRGKAIDAMATLVRLSIEPVEKHLEDQEKFEERQEADRKAKLKAEREATLAPYGLNTAFYYLENMDEAAFGQLLANTRAAHEARLEQERKAEEDRKAAEKRRINEEARIRAENERLRKEATEKEEAARQERLKEQAAREFERQRVEAASKATAEKARREREAIEAKARKEKEAAEAQAAKERVARERVERELAEAKASEDRRKAEENKKAEAMERERRKAAAAPEAQKLKVFAALIRGGIPKLKDAALASLVNEQSVRFAKWLEFKASEL